MKRALVLLTLDNVDALSSSFERLPRACCHETFALDAGSTDGTRQLLEARHLRVEDRAPGGAGRGLLAAASRTDADYIVCWQPQAGQALATIPALFDALEDGADLALASRFVPDGSALEDSRWLRPRKWAALVRSLAINTLHNRGPYVMDAASAFYGARRLVLASLPAAADWDADTGLVGAALGLGWRVAEVPTQELSAGRGVSVPRRS